MPDANPTNSSTTPNRSSEPLFGNHIFVLTSEALVRLFYILITVIRSSVYPRTDDRIMKLRLEEECGFSVVFYLQFMTPTLIHWGGELLTSFASHLFPEYRRERTE